MLDPICKVQEITFYEYVKESVRKNGLYHPLIIHPITAEEWKKELEVDGSQLPPDWSKGGVFHRIQCGCNRWYALKEFGYDAVECIVEEDVEKARELCRVMRSDKRWQRGTNWVKIREEKV